MNRSRTTLGLKKKNQPRFPKDGKLKRISYLQVCCRLPAPLICDSSGACATVVYIDGVHTHPHTSLPEHVRR